MAGAEGTITANKITSIKMKDPQHPIVNEPWQYRIIGFNYQVDPAGYEDSYIDLTLQKDSIVRRLRFTSPQDLTIEKGFPNQTFGMIILDISKRQMEELNVQVDDFESNGGAVRFYAKDVIDLDAVK